MLERILAAKRKAIEARMRERPLESFRGALAPSDRSLLAGLRRGRTGFILECKKASPSAGLLRADFDPAALARDYADVADAVSVITDEPFFQGRLEYLERVRGAVDLPVLCKDFVVDPYQVHEARRFGADAILLMLSVLTRDAEVLACLDAAREWSMDALVEVHDASELARALALGVPLIGINNRDLHTLDVRLETTEALAPLVPQGTTVIAESGLATRAQVRRLRPLVDGFLVGSSLAARPDPGHAARELAVGRVKVCGLTRPDDVREAWKAGAVFGGMIFAEESPRRLTLPEAERLRNTAPLRWVGVFVNESPAAVAETAEALGLAAVQLHGEEGPGDVRALRALLPEGVEIWKAHREGAEAARPADLGADRLLLDTHDPHRRGGTGRPFDWSLLRGTPDLERCILAGGLGTGNAEAADRAGAWALDVNSGVESAPGRKDAETMKAFFRILRGWGRTSGGAAL